MLDSGADFIKLMASGGRMTPGSDPASPQYDVQELQAICEEAHAEGRKVAAHVLSAEAAKRCLAAGVDHLEHCEWQRPEGGSGYNLRHAEEMAERDVVVGLTIPGLVRGALSGQDAARGQEAQERAYAAYSPYRDMRRRGVEVMLSSDAGVRLTPFRDFHHSLQAFAYLLNCSPAEALLAATSIPARALGLDSDVGTLEAGKRADILVIDGDPLKDLANVARVSMVVQSGRVTAAAGWLALPDGRRLSSETGGTTSPSRQRGD
jgi:imidazolonepropionase-like amidohydrolase